MKFAKITFGIIFGVILIIWIIGLVAGKVEYKVSVEVNAPVEVAWEVFVTDSLMADWLEGLRSIENIEGDSLTPGAKFRLIFEDQGNRYEMIEIMTAVEKQKLFAFDGESDIMTSHSEITFASNGKSTVISDHSSFAAKGFVFKAVLPFMKNVMAERSESIYLNLASLIEKKYLAMEIPETGE